MRIQLRRRARSGSASARRGITLIEVIIALTMFAVVTTSMASMTTHIAHGSRLNAIGNVRAGVLAAQVNRLEALNYDSLPSRAGCTSVSTGLLPRSECMWVQDVPAGRRVTYVLRPSNTAFRPDTVVFERTKPKGYNPVNLF